VSAEVTERKVTIARPSPSSRRCSSITEVQTRITPATQKRTAVKTRATG